MMLDVAGGIIIAGIIIGLLYSGGKLLAEDTPAAYGIGFTMIGVALLAVAWILLVHTGIVTLPKL